MKTKKSILLGAAALLLQGAAFGAVPYDTTEIPYAPVYARWLGPDSPEAPQWVSFTFYRSSDDIPEDFNLLDFFDFADRNGNFLPDGFEPALLVEGFQIFEDEFNPFDPVPPFFAFLKEIDEVPIWFISVDDWLSAIEDDDLTIGELKGLDSLLIGSASFYTEIAQVSSDPFGGGGANVPKFHLLARGTLEDGRTFGLQFTEVKQKNIGWMTLVYRIKFK